MKRTKLWSLAITGHVRKTETCYASNTITNTASTTVSNTVRQTGKQLQTYRLVHEKLATNFHTKMNLKIIQQCQTTRLDFHICNLRKIVPFVHKHDNSLTTVQ